MRIIRDRADARWLPSRCRFAIFRLIAYIRLQTVKPEPARGLALTVQRDQNAVEAFVVAISAVVVVTSFLATVFDDVMSLAAAIPLAFIVTVTCIQIVIVVVGVIVLPLKPRMAPLAASSAIIMMMIIAIAALLAAGESPVRHVGTMFLAAIAANALAAVIVFVLERPIANAEERFGAGT